MNKHIRTKTNQIYSKIKKSTGNHKPGLDPSKLVDRRIESRYHAGNSRK